MVATLSIAAPGWGQVVTPGDEAVAATPFDEGLYIPRGPGSTAPEPIRSILPLLNKRVRVQVRGSQRTVDGRLISVTSNELVVVRWGVRSRIPLADVTRIEAIAETTNHASRWLTAAGLAGVGLAYFFGKLVG